jgi:S1-C subfamily serine protease
MIHPHLRFLTGLFCAAPFTAIALLANAAPRPPLPPEFRTNGEDSTTALRPLRVQTEASVASFLDPKGHLLITGTCVGGEGYFLTKASELPNVDRARLLLPDGRMTSMREVHRDSALDLVLVQAIESSQVKAVEPSPGRSLSFGQWLTAPADGGKKVCVGVVSARKREIKGFGAALGVRMDDDTVQKNGGVRITGIADDGPAAMAGLQENDVLVSVAGEKVGRYDRVHEIMSSRQAGEEVEVRFRRSGKEATTTVRLASRSKVLNNWDGEDFANGGVSIRTDSFSEVLQHDMPLGPEDMGGPVMDLEGRVVGINIARVDRVTTFALPTEAFWPTVQRWIDSDRHPPRAVVATADEPAAAIMTPVAREPESRGPHATLHQAH